jgi:3-deoxy-D-manno-octulosonate 8-phosphate phosphatase (KDO 8-P phosphatase)
MERERAVSRASDDALAAKLARVRLVALDCDGVMTDGGLYYAADGSELRRFNVRDGVGIKALMAAGIDVAFVSASRTPAIEHRAAALGVPHCLTGVEDKLGALRTLCARRDIPLEQVAHVGDDVNDLPLLRAVGVPMTVADAIPEAIAVALYVSRRKGGEGAVRDIAERILAARVDAAPDPLDSGTAARSGTARTR